MYARRMAGVTLVELVIAMVIISAALAGLVAALARATRASADPIVSQQMVAIAETMMEEVLLKPYGIPAPVGGGAGSRVAYDDIWDYNGYAGAVSDVNGDAIPGLDRFTIAVAVTALPANSLGGIATASHAASIQVTVRNGAESLVLTGWRTQP